MTSQQPPTLRPEIRERLHQGVVIPAHPLALTADHTLDRQRQAALTRYYLGAGAGGVAVGVHTTQFEIRQHGLYEDVLRITIDVVNEQPRPEPVITVAGVIGPTESALGEARLARALGYHLVLVGLGGLASWTEQELVTHVARIAEVMPVFGFYLQPSVGGRPLSHAFWRQMAEIPNVQAIKIAPFNRYQTLDVVRAVAESSRRHDIALYTGNDDNNIADLLTTWRFTINGEQVEKRIVGGLLGHWAVWTERAVAQLARCHAALATDDGAELRELLTLGQQVTDSNAAFFDSANGFAGCIPGVHEVLRRQGLLEGTWCLDPQEVMSPGQQDQIDRVYAMYPHLNEDAFVRDHLDGWLAPDLFANPSHSHVEAVERPRVLVLASPDEYREFVAPEAHAKLRSLADVTFRESDEPWTQEQALDAIGAYDGLITGLKAPVMTDEVLDAATRLTFIGHIPGSVKRFVKENVFERGIRVSSGSLGMAPAVAEFSLILVFLGLRAIHEYDNGMRRTGHCWDDPHKYGPAQELAGQRIGVVGAGMIGRMFIRKVRALGATPWVFDPYLTSADATGLGARKVELADLCCSCPIVVIHAPTTPETRHMIGERELALLVDNAWLVNTSRSWVVDEGALLSELQTGRIRAALDVFDTEPLPLDHPLRSLPNVLLTPHIGSATVDGRHRQGTCIVRDFENLLHGRPLEFEVTPDRYPILA